MKKIEEILKELHADNDYTTSTDFIADGLLDSFDLMRLLSLLESEYGVHIAGTDLMPMNFTSIEAIKKLLSSYGVKDCE